MQAPMDASMMQQQQQPVQVVADNSMMQQQQVSYQPVQQLEPQYAPQQRALDDSIQPVPEIVEDRQNIT